VRARWTCSRCLVRVHFAPGFEPPGRLPEGWERKGSQLRCLACRRAAAVETALAEAEREQQRRTAGAVRREALVRFELERDATRTNAQVAAVIGCSPAAVAGLRRELGLPPPPRPAVVRRCPECEAEFVSTNARRRFCSRRCIQRAHRRSIREAAA
jgi:hypothetical protein